MVAVTIQADSKFPVNRKLVRQAVWRVTDEYGLKSAQVGIVVVGTRKMRSLQQQWLKRDGVTDVLAFPLEGGFDQISGPLTLGDVVVCWPVAVRSAAEKNILVDDEINTLVEHGIRHLLGEHHD